MSLSDYPRRDNPLGMDMDKRDSLSEKIRKYNYPNDQDQERDREEKQANGWSN